MYISRWLRVLANLCNAGKDQDKILRTVFDRLFEFVCLCLPDGTVIDANEALVARAKNVHNIDVDDFFGKPMWILPWWKNKQDMIVSMIEQVKEKRITINEMLSHVKTTGEEVFIDVSMTPVFDSEGKKIKYLIVEGRDVSESVIQSRQIQYLDSITQAFTSAPDFHDVMPNLLESLLTIFKGDRARILKFKVEQKHLIAEVAWHKGMNQWDTEEVRTRTLLFDEELITKFRTQIETGQPIVLTGQGVPIALKEIDVKSLVFVPIQYNESSGLTDLMWGIVIHQCSHERTWTRSEINLLKEAGRRIKEVLSSYLLFERVHKYAFNDTLTGLPNRLFFHQQLDLLIERYNNTSNKFAIFLVDVDNFKRINDTQGHNVGDMCLQEIALRIDRSINDRCKELKRKHECPSCLNESCEEHEKCLCFVSRLGGDEFVIVYEYVTDIGNIAKTAEDLMKYFEETVRGHHITLSIGISIFPDDGTSPSTLLKSADLAMYAAKKEGKDQFLFHDSTMNKELEEFVVYERLLRGMIHEDAFDIHYQPIIDVGTEKIVGVEILLRTIEPDPSIRIDKLIYIAEETGLMIPLGKKILEKACNNCSRCGFYEKIGVPISVNLSITQLEEENIVDIIEQTLIKTNFNPSNLVVEITETVFMHDFEENVKKLDRLNKLGINVSMDDFGKGYSSLAYLQRLPITKIKIDMSFIRTMIQEEKSMEIVKAMILMSRSLGITTCAEGVETREQFETLKQFGCDQVQGYFFHKPMKQVDLKQLLLAQCCTTEDDNL